MPKTKSKDNTKKLALVKKPAASANHAASAKHSSGTKHAAASVKSAGDLLRAFIDTHEKNVDSFAKKLGVGVASVYRWLGASGPRSKIVRLAIEKKTKGAVPAAMWPEVKNRWTAAKEAEAVKASKKLAKKRAKKRAKKKAAKRKPTEQKLASVTSIAKPAATPVPGDPPEAA